MRIKKPKAIWKYIHHLKGRERDRERDIGTNEKRIGYGISELLESIYVSCGVKVHYMPFAC